jgi:AcrR family transcriptional regulator
MTSPKRQPLVPRGSLSGDTRTDLIAAGRRLFAARGFDGTSVRALTKAAHANLGAVTYHFGSKYALYEAVLEDGLRPLAERVEEAGAGTGSALERILQVVGAYFEHLGRHPELPRLLLQQVAAGKHPPEVVARTIGRIKSVLVRLQTEGVEDGSVRRGDPVLTALSIASQPVYFSLIAPLARSVVGIDLTAPDTRDETLSHLTGFVRAALTPPQGAGT